MNQFFENYPVDKKVCLFIGDITRCGGTEAISVLLANELINKNTEIIIVSLFENNSKIFFQLDSRIKHISLFVYNLNDLIQL